MQCPACGGENRAGARFCEDCGARLELTCPSCGAAATPAKRFCGDCGAALTTPPSVGTPLAAPSRPDQDTGWAQQAAPLQPPLPEERRWATVLFADLAGYTSLSERMDPEDVKELTHHCAERLSEEIRRFGGTVVNVMGDGVLAVFGAPVAHEDDAERAVRAALAMCECSLTTPGGADLQVHVGINTGELMAGLIGPEERRHYTVVGDTVNTTARLMHAAPAGQVLVGEETYLATRRAVRYRAVPPVEARGKERPVPAWEALETSPLPEARPLGTAPLVGRDDELAVLAGIWTKVVREGRPHLVTVLGEPGIGKSRLVAELEGRILREATVLHGRCLPYGTVLGYWALAMAMKEAAGIGTEDDPESARTKLGDLVDGVIGSGPGKSEGDPGEIARHLALLTGLDLEADRAAPAGDQRTLHASARRFLEALARQRPLCVVLEDIHWADDALLDLIEHVAARASEAPLLIVAQARPELLEKRPAWGRGVRAFTSLPLEPLDERAGRALILALCRERGLSPDVAERVGRGSGGNPLFAEELVATIAERGGEAGDGIPSAIKALISARLDALPAAERRALQLASVVGKHFWAGSVQELVRGEDAAPRSDVAERLDALVQKDLLRAQSRSRFRGDQEYAFKHDLIRDVAYETLPRSERRTLHGQVANWIEQVEGERAEELLDLLAHHAVQANQQQRALGYLTRAAERAWRAAAHREEAALLARAIEIAERLGQSDQVAELRASRGRAFASVAMWAEARPELETALVGLAPERAEGRAEVLEDLAEVCFLSQDTPSARRHATEALSLAEKLGRTDLEVAAMGWLASTDGAAGDVASGLDRFQRATAQAETLGIPTYGPALMQYPLMLYWTGQIDQAVKRGLETVQGARALNDASATMFSLPQLGMALAACGRYDEAVNVFGEARRFGREYEVWPFLARAIAMSAGLHLDLFDFEGNEAIMEEARDLARTYFPPTVVSAGIDLLLNYSRRGEVGRAEGLVDGVAQAAGWHGWLWKLRLAEARAEMALARGDSEEAIRRAGEAIEQSRAKGRVKYEALGLGTRAWALDGLGRTKKAIADLRQAVRLARRTGDPAMLLRAATALLAIDGDDALAAESRAVVERIAAALPDDEMRQRFEAAEPVRTVLRLATA